MAAVRGRDNRAEKVLRRTLWGMGYRYRLQNPQLQGRPDITLPRYRVVIFVDGDFWHGRSIIDDGVDAFRKTLRTERREWWVTKIGATITRDRKVTLGLIAAGWQVIRMWESDVLRDPMGVAHSVAASLKRKL